MTWVPKDLSVDTGDVPPGAVALAIRVFLPLPAGLSGPPPDDLLCRPFRINNVIGCDGFNVIAVSVGGMFLTNIKDIDVRVESGTAVVVWVGNNGRSSAAFHGKIYGMEELP